MCGRFALDATEEEIMAHFQLYQGFSMRSRFNMAPGQTIPVIREWGKQIDFYRWGFIPYWAKSTDDKIPTGHINARVDSLATKPTFKAAFKKQRCLIPVTGYFEWRDFAGKKQPFYFALKDQPLFAFAGIWSRWQSPTHGEVLSVAIITQDAPLALQKYHHRMPVILLPAQYRTWLHDSKEQSITDLLQSSSALDFIIHPVTWRMNNPRFEGKECIQSL